MNKNKLTDRYGRSYSPRLHVGPDSLTRSGYLRIKKGASNETRNSSKGADTANRKTFKDVAGKTVYRDKVDGTIRLV